MNYSDINNDDFFKKQLDSSIKSSRTYINRIIGAVTIVEQSQRYENDEVISDLVFSSCKLLSQNMNMSYLYSDDLYDSVNAVINAGELLTGIITECTNLLETIEREIQFVVNCQSSLIKINEKIFTIAFMNILQNALLYSPAKSTVVVSLENPGNEICISVTNLNAHKDYKFFKPPEENFGLGIALCVKIAEHHGGKFDFTQSKGRTVAKLFLPLESDNSDFILYTDYADYISEKFKPVRLFIYEVLYENNR
jgi:signal transduction histidine kinase